MKLTFRFTAEEANLILKALGELPAKTSMKLMQSIYTQAENQPKLVEPEPPKNTNTEEKEPKPKKATK